MTGQTLINFDYWLWGILILQAAFMFWCLRHREALGGIIVFLAGLLALESLGKTHFLQFAQLRPGDAVAIVFVYFTIGVLWGMFQWWVHVKNARYEYEVAKVNWLDPRNLARQATHYRELAERVQSEERRNCYLAWSQACEKAANRGGGLLTPELQPVWREFVHDRGQLNIV